MANGTILHSGGFLDMEDKKVIVTFFKKTDLNAEPRLIIFPEQGGTATLTIWSNTGSARPSDAGLGPWLNYQQAGAEPIPDTVWYKYTYNIICEPNDGYDREARLMMYIEAGEGIGDRVYVYVKQDGPYGSQ